jgi:hypothetical protein
VENPSQNLESYFLDVVQKARAAQETSGAQSGARVAAYLRGPDTVGAGDPANRVLERLSAPAAPAAPAVAPATPNPPAVNDRKLESLAKPVEAKPAAPRPEPGPVTPPVDLAKANEKLSSLLGGPKP